MATEPEDREFIESPDELDDDHEKNGPTCFIDGMRICGSDCMAFNTFTVVQGGELSMQQKRCSLLVAANRLGRHSGILAKAITNVIQDQVRASATSPPDPMGGKG